MSASASAGPVLRIEYDEEPCTRCKGSGARAGGKCYGCEGRGRYHTAAARRAIDFGFRWLRSKLGKPATGPSEIAALAAALDRELKGAGYTVVRANESVRSPEPGDDPRGDRA